MGRLILGLGILATLVVGCGSSGGKKAATSAAELAAVQGKYDPSVDPADFVARVDNPLWPLKPGTAFHYVGTRGNTPQKDDELVTQRTKRIVGIRCTVVRDTVSEHGLPIERTLDFYAQDKHGNVWYLGEDSFERQHGRFVRASDSWRSGVNGAKPGIIMPADPRAGDRYRQEYYPPGEALDQAHVLALDASLRVPAGSFDHVLSTEEWSPVEPQMEAKFYASGLGEVKEQVTAGGHEQFSLVSVTHG